ncbi:hypothetical protein H0H93_000357 [Arthromyces matolae]|nr:hypothetical protein H0H93_000357 [Arthromyces matolae]
MLNSAEPPYPAEPELLEVPYYSYNDWTSSGPNGTTWYTRAHRFLTGREAGGIKPVFGLTANILIRVSTIAYGHPPEFDVNPPNAPSLRTRLAWTVISKPDFREAFKRENIKVDWDRLKHIAGVKEGDGVSHKKQLRKSLASKLSFLLTTTSLRFETAQMPAPAAAVTVAAIVGFVAVGFAFTKFVYEPHIAPKLEQWAEEFLAHREARRNQRAGMVPVLAAPHQRERQSIDKRSDSDGIRGEERESIELENLIAKEVHEWRNEVNRSSTIRRRMNKSGTRYSPEASDTHNHGIHYTFCLWRGVRISMGDRRIDASPARHASYLREAGTVPIPHSPPTVKGLGLLPTPAASSTMSAAPQNASLSPPMVPSLSQLHPLELDQEHGVELLSAPSSRPDTPFSSFSQRLSPLPGTNVPSSHYYSFSSPNTTSVSRENVMSPSARPPSRTMSDLDFLSDLSSNPDPMSPHWSDAAVVLQDESNFDDRSSDVSSSSWASAGVHSH